MNLSESEYIGNVLIAVIVTGIFGLLVATLAWGSFRLVSSAARPPVATNGY